MKNVMLEASEDTALQSREILQTFAGMMGGTTNLPLPSPPPIPLPLSRRYTLKLLAETCVQRRCETSFRRRCTV